MKFILFCLNDYSFSILNPIKEVLVKRNYNFIWYVAPKLKNKFPFKNDKFTSSYRKLKSYKSDVIFAPGNEVPFFLRGLKTQIFHGLAGEKKDTLEFVTTLIYILHRDRILLIDF